MDIYNMSKITLTSLHNVGFSFQLVFKLLTGGKRVEKLSSHLQLVVFGAKCCVLLSDHLLQLSDELLGLGESLCHFFYSDLSGSSSSAGRAWALRRDPKTHCVSTLHRT